MRRAAPALLTMAALLLAGAGLFGLRLGLDFLATPPESAPREVVVTVEPGSTFARVAHQLANEGLVSDPEAFVLLGRLTGNLRSLKAGEFRLDASWGPMRTLDALTRGQGVLYKLSVPEGLTWRETATLVEQAGLGSRKSFRMAVHDSELLAEHGIPADSAEGYLFPETYFLPKPREGNAYPAARAMLAQFHEEAESVWPRGLPSPDKLHRLVILASLVEKETAAPSERKRIAGVYANRLELGMLLQCDPTVIYGLGDEFDGNLTRDHLRDRDNPYNTYRHRGLPPGPICSPGLAALEAAADPEEHDFLYFVSKKDGTHHFSRTLSEHNRAVRRFQLGRR
ncbi:endolytic transglycosylase MltG [Desulfohalovibrio reitneri]|uniref:endolytic transglycosylase MltG n=1 Tax=Desulfohalovibrio reitneri TaxID=1307759 RepID=UPI0004A6E72A|nr:endolytic transglycosylase MltG [Desulfohalovibrio reitneri]